MSNPNQKAVRNRQIIYFGLIIALLTLSLLWRGKESFRPSFVDDGRVAALHQARRTADFTNVPEPRSAVNSVVDWLASRTILDQASRDSLDLREVDQGDAEVSAAFVRLTLTGSRGLAVTYLWRQAMEYQKRNEFHKFEQTVNAVVRLQPNFTTPWLYQSWNISYNVSVENDRLTDMYYYIARGIELLAKGERLNRDSPDMRYYIAFYYQNKFSVSDKVTTLRSMMQLSAIKPGDRNPDSMRDQTDPDQRQRFQDFVRKNPQLCRRLREKLGYTKPEQIVQFLDDNSRVPTRYDHTRQDAVMDSTEQFPALPPRFAEGPDELNPGVSELDDTFDAFMAARAWFLYSLTVVPPPQSDPDAPRLKPSDMFRYRIPKAPTLIIFRQGAPRAQTYLAERLQKEGWFDADSRWYPDQRADSSAEFWFGARNDGTPGEALASNASSREAWVKAHAMWSLHGERNGLKFSPAQLLSFEELARAVPNDDRIGSYDDEQLKSLGLRREQIRARNILRAYDRNRTMTNIGYFLSSTEAEQDPQTVKARQKLFDAEQTEIAGRKPEAIRQYIDALGAWRQVLLKFKDFHRSEKPEEDTFEMQLKLVALLEKSPEIQERARQGVIALQAVMPFAHETVVKYPPVPDFAREIAEREANLRIAQTDPQVVERVNQLISAPTDDAVMAKDWHVVLKWKRAIAAELASRAAKQPLNAAQRQQAADEPQWRKLAVEKLLEAGTKPTAWADLTAARDEIARAVVEREYDWLPEYREPFKDPNNMWIRDDSKRIVNERLGRVRHKSTESTVEVQQPQKQHARFDHADGARDPRPPG